jgi:DNA gyrase/topoisomerase IV subunit B
MAISKYDENSIITLAPREAIRSSIGMYIGNSETGGMHHLAEEIICNAMDEAAAGFGKEIIVNVDTASNTLTVKDSGRGIPFRMNKSGKYAIIEMCTDLHSGGKMEGQSNYKSAIGLNGVGATVTQALSSYFKIISTREDGVCTLIIDNGKITKMEIVDGPHKETGSIVSFIPDNSVFKGIKWEDSQLLAFLQNHAVMNDGIRFSLYRDLKLVNSFCYDNGMLEFLQENVDKDSKPITHPIYYKCDDGTNIVEIALQYTMSKGEDTFAFTNGAYNPDLGTHVTGFRSAFTSLINTKAREYKLLDLNDDNLDGTLLRRGMTLVLSLKMAERPQFNEQQKLKLTSTSARAIVSQAVSKMTMAKSDVEAIVKKAILEKKAEDAAQRKREAEKRIISGGVLNTLTDLPEKFAGANNKSGCELFIVEGKSAAGSAKTARDANTQAIYPMRGKPLNTYHSDLDEIIKNQEIKDILTILGTGVGEKFNIANLRYDKIIFMADADADGMHINCLLTALFLDHLPELLEAGKVYCAVPPLFKVTKGNEYHYLYKPEQLKQYSGWEVYRYKGLGEQSPEELWESTMDPARRTLVQLKIDDVNSVKSLYDVIMGNSPQQRKDFIMRHAREYSLVNVDGTDVELEGDDDE